MNWYNGFPPEQRMEALNWLKAEQSAGRRALKATKCMGCGQEHGIIDFHSENYSKPFGPHIGEYQFCYRCHMMLHCRFKSPDQWLRYLDLLRKGHSWTPTRTRNFGLIRAFLCGGGNPDLWGRVRPLLVFDKMNLRATNDIIEPPSPQMSFL